MFSSLTAWTTVMVADDRTRLETKTLRSWQLSDRSTCVERPDVAALSKLSSHATDERTFGVAGVLPEVADYFSQLWDDAVSRLHEASGSERSEAGPSVEQARAGEDSGIVGLDMEWQGDFFEESAANISARFSDPRLPSLSPGRTGRSGVFSSDSSHHR